MTDRFTHIVDGKRRHRNSGERFHFHPRSRKHTGFARYDQFIVLPPEIKLHGIQADRMAQRNQIAGSFRRVPWTAIESITGALLLGGMMMGGG